MNSRRRTRSSASGGREAPGSGADLDRCPGRTRRATRTTSLLRIRMQPLLAAVPISSGRLVPWMATRPFPPANSLSRSEYPVMGNTIGPRNAPAWRISSAIAKWSLRGVSVPASDGDRRPDERPVAAEQREPPLADVDHDAERRGVDPQDVEGHPAAHPVRPDRQQHLGPAPPLLRDGAGDQERRRPVAQGAIGWSTVRAFADVRGAVRAVTGTSTRPTQASFGVGGPERARPPGGPGGLTGPRPREADRARRGRGRRGTGLPSQPRYRRGRRIPKIRGISATTTAERSDRARRSRRRGPRWRPCAAGRRAPSPG